MFTKIKSVLFLCVFCTFYTTHLSAQDNLIIDGIPCNIHGSSKDGSLEYIQNVKKNRYNFPAPTSFDNSITLKELIDRNANESKFSTDKSVRISGYVFQVKPGGKETCNCKTGDEAFKDTHIELTPDNQHTDAQYRMIVEITPRMRQEMEKQGIDWSTATLKSKLEGHVVNVEGWLFYDKIHEMQSFSINPDNTASKNWRASCWEIHPITKIDLVEESDDNSTQNYTSNEIMSSNYPPNNNQSISQNKSAPMNQANTPLNTLMVILIGGILGAVGQGIRVIVGVKKVNDMAVKTATPVNSIIDYKSMAFSLIIAFAIGGMAGVIAAITSDNIQFTKATFIAFITAGYAGTDFIEGFIKKYPGIQNVTNSISTTSTTITKVE